MQIWHYKKEWKTLGCMAICAVCSLEIVVIWPFSLFVCQPRWEYYILATSYCIEMNFRLGRADDHIFHRLWKYVAAAVSIFAIIHNWLKQIDSIWKQKGSFSNRTCCQLYTQLMCNVPFCQAYTLKWGSKSQVFAIKTNRLYWDWHDIDLKLLANQITFSRYFPLLYTYVYLWMKELLCRVFPQQPLGYYLSYCTKCMRYFCKNATTQ